jgi:hypothetical protein
LAALVVGCALPSHRPDPNWSEWIDACVAAAHASAEGPGSFETTVVTGEATQRRNGRPAYYFVRLSWAVAPFGAEHVRTYSCSFSDGRMIDAGPGPATFSERPH